MGGFGFTFRDAQAVSDQGLLNESLLGEHRREIVKWCQKKALVTYEGGTKLS